MRVWNALIDGPVDTCYEDGLFTLRMEFTGILHDRASLTKIHETYSLFILLETYPLTPPNVRFTCKMFHPNGKFKETNVECEFIFNDKKTRAGV